MVKKIKKVILNSEHLYGNENNDLFLELKLCRSNDLIQPESYDNDFDLEKQFKNERNNSNNFIVYGIINSPIDLSSLSLSCFVSTSEISTGTEGQFVIDSLDQNEITLDNGIILERYADINVSWLREKGNVFGIRRKKYFLQVDDFNYDLIFILSEGNNFDPQLFYQRLKFYNHNNEEIDYGSDVEIIRDDGTTYTVNNDFPFFYGRHWVKNNISITK